LGAFQAGNKSPTEVSERETERKMPKTTKIKMEDVIQNMGGSRLLEDSHKVDMFHGTGRQKEYGGR
jgi:hypothetical protein